MKTKKRRTSTEVCFSSKYRPEQIWEVLVHPKYAEELAIKKCYTLEIPQEFSLEKGKTYREIHNGEACMGDICEYKILQSIPYKLFKKVKHQTGLKEITTYTLAYNETENQTLINEVHQYSISFKALKLKYLLHWIFLHLGLITKFIDLEEDKKWFKNVEKKIGENL